MIGRYYQDFSIDTGKGLSNYTNILKTEALRYIYKRQESAKIEPKPFFLYWAPDATHGPTYSSEKFRETSSRGSAFGDAVRELDNAIGEISLQTLSQVSILSNPCVVQELCQFYA